MKTGILFHGLHLQAKDWENIQWGNPRAGVFGIMPTGLREALFTDAARIYLSTGMSSEKDGLTEGAYAARFLREKIHELEPFDAWGIDTTNAWLEERLALDIEPATTVEELRVTAKNARADTIERLILVANPSHSMRALKIALSLMQSDENMRTFRHSLCVIPSDVPFAGTSVDDVIIFEPPHRPDRPQVHFNETLKPLLELALHPTAEQLNRDLAAVIARYTRK